MTNYTEEFNSSIVTALIQGAQTVAENTCRQAISKDPDIATRDIIEYDSRLNISALEKFNGPCYIAALNFFVNQAAQEEGNACGALIIYFEEEAAGDILKYMQPERVKDPDDPEFIMEQSVKFIEQTADLFNQEIQKHGYPSLILSKPTAFVNTIQGGLSFRYEEQHYLEIGFTIKKHKSIVLNLTFPPQEILNR